MQRRQHEVTGQGGLDRDRRRLPVADLTDENDVGIGAKDRLERGGEEKTGLAVDLDLGDPVEPILDRVLDRDDVHLGQVQECPASSTSVVVLPEPVGTRDQDGTIRFGVGLAIPFQVVGQEAEVAKR